MRARTDPGPSACTEDMAAQLRAEARAAEKDPNYFSKMIVGSASIAGHPALFEIKTFVTAETEAKRDHQVHAGRSGKRKWHEIADPILIELRGIHPGWNSSDLRRELEARGLPGLPGTRAIDEHIADMVADGRLPARQK
jgi:hypothetical protein